MPAQQERPALTFIASEMSEESNDLHGLAQPGLVCQDAIEVLAVQLGQPVQADLLVVS